MQVKELASFYNSIREDNRISPSHISLYMAFFQYWNDNDFQNPVQFKRSEIMQAAKINGLATYHRCIKQLHEYGYITYSPSFNPSKCSQVVILNRE
jgi:hypothetical protein